MNAQHSNINVDNRFVIKQFISYDTPIAQYTYDTKYDSYHIAVNEKCFKFSSSTTRQFSRWLSEETIFSASDIYDALSMELPSTPDVSDYRMIKGTISIASKNYLDRVWR